MRKQPSLNGENGGDEAGLAQVVSEILTGTALRGVVGELLKRGRAGCVNSARVILELAAQRELSDSQKKDRTDTQP